MRGRTPEPPTNPPEPKHTHSDHDIWMDNATYDHDGPSVTQQENHDSPILDVVIEYMSCRRDGCDAAHDVQYIYTMDGMSDRLEAAVRGAAGREYEDNNIGIYTVEEAMAEYVAQHVTIVDYDESPVLAVEFGDDTFGYWHPTTHEDNSTSGGQCHGHVDEATRLGI